MLLECCLERSYSFVIWKVIVLDVLKIFLKIVVSCVVRISYLERSYSLVIWKDIVLYVFKIFLKIVVYCVVRISYLELEECCDSSCVGSNESLLGVPLGRHLGFAGCSRKLFLV